MLPDVANASFELIGAILAWVNFRKLQQDGEVKGVYWPVTGFFALWGFWNLYYYPSLGQWFSFWAGIVLVSANTAWVILAMQLERKANGNQQSSST